MRPILAASFWSNEDNAVTSEQRGLIIVIVALTITYFLFAGHNTKHQRE